MTDRLAPGSRIGILGGGQLGRMLALAAAEMGFSTHIYCPEEASPAAEVATHITRGAYEDETELAKFAAQVDVITYEFENVPAKTAEFLSTLKPVRPGVAALATAQDRLVEKDFMRANGIATAPYTQINSLDDLTQALRDIGTPAILKTRRFGYDGKGQTKIGTLGDAENAWQEIGQQPAILEGFVPFAREISVLVARNSNGDLAAYEPGENVHLNHILHTTTVPANIEAPLVATAMAIAEKIAAQLNYVGIMGVEFFHVPGNETTPLVVNEIAPRVHNSGHWTQDACQVSQFEQHIRAICNWPLGPTNRLSDVIMTNLIGDDIDEWDVLLSSPNTALHMYNKAQARPGRKMGHINQLNPRAI